MILLAPHYRDYSASKAPYLDAIDKIIVDRIPAGARSLLDVGAGDGVRAVKIYPGVAPLRIGVGRTQRSNGNTLQTTSSK